MRNHADADDFLHLQRDGDDVVAAQIRRTDAGGNGSGRPARMSGTAGIPNPSC